MRVPVPVLLLFGLLVAASACDATTGTPSTGPTVTPVLSTSPSPAAIPTQTPTATPTPTPTATKKPFFPKLFANGAGSFAGATGAPVGSVCSVKAFLTSGRDVSGPGLKPKTVKDASAGVSWDGQDGQLFALPSPAPSPAQKAYWQVRCTNPAYEPSPPTNSTQFDLP